MQIIIDLIVGFFKVAILLIGGAMLVGGGSCAAIMLVSSLGGNNLGQMLLITFIAIAVALIGWGLIKAVKFKPSNNIKNNSQEANPSNDDEQP